MFLHYFSKVNKAKTYTVDEAKLVLEKYCIYQDRCHQEVLNKLYKMKMIDEAKELILIHLIQHNFLNEERFAKSFARGKFHQKKWGKIKIANQLILKKISTLNISTALNEIEENDYLDTIKSLILKKIAQLNLKNQFEIRKKVSLFMRSKGYEWTLVIKVLDEVLGE